MPDRSRSSRCEFWYHYHPKCWQEAELWQLFRWVEKRGLRYSAHMVHINIRGDNLRGHVAQGMRDDGLTPANDRRDARILQETPGIPWTPTETPRIP